MSGDYLCTATVVATHEGPIESLIVSLHPKEHTVQVGFDRNG